MTIEEYKNIFEGILKISFDVEEEIDIDNPTEEDINKAKWIKAMVTCINDVPFRRAAHILRTSNTEFDYCAMLDELDK
jgi:hypothetical protein